MRPKTKVHEYFKENKDVNGHTTYSCSFCGKKYAVRNATKFARHLANNCNQCPVTVKSSFGKKREDEVEKENQPPQTQGSSHQEQSTDIIFNQVSILPRNR